MPSEESESFFDKGGQASQVQPKLCDFGRKPHVAVDFFKAIQAETVGLRRLGKYGHCESGNQQRRREGKIEACLKQPGGPDKKQDKGRQAHGVQKGPLAIKYFADEVSGNHHCCAERGRALLDHQRVGRDERQHER